MKKILCAHAISRLRRLLFSKILQMVFLCLYISLIIINAKYIYSNWQSHKDQNKFDKIISSDEPFVRSTALRIVEEEKKSNFFKKVREKFEDDEKISTEELGIFIYEYVNQKWQYYDDPAGREYLAKPKETIENGYKGDCDDYAICLAALLKAIGLNVRLTSMIDDWSGHLYPSFLIDEDFLRDYETEESQKFYCDVRYASYNDKDIQFKEEYDKHFDAYLYWLIMDWKDNYGGSNYYLDDINKVIYSSLNTTSTFTFLKDIGIRIILMMFLFIGMLAVVFDIKIPTIIAIFNDELRILFRGKYSEFLSARYLIIKQYYNSFEVMRIPHVINENNGEKKDLTLALVPGFLTDYLIQNEDEFELSKDEIIDSIKKYKLLKEKYSKSCHTSIFGDKLVFKTLKDTLEVRIFINFMNNKLYYDPVLSYKFEEIEAAFTRKYFLDRKKRKSYDVFKLYLTYALDNNYNHCEFICDAEMADEIICFFNKYPDAEANDGVNDEQS